MSEPNYTGLSKLTELEDFLEPNLSWKLTTNVMAGVILLAAEEAYQSEVVDTGMERVDEQYKEDWIAEKLDAWVREAAP